MSRSPDTGLDACQHRGGRHLGRTFSKGNTINTTVSGAGSGLPTRPHVPRHLPRRTAVGAVAGALVTGVLALGVPSPAAAADPAYVVSRTISLGYPVGDGMAVDSTRHKAYVTHPDHDLVSVVDLTTNTVSGTIPVGGYPFRVAVDEGTGRAYVANTNGSTVTEIDTTTDTVVRTIPGFSNPRGLEVDPTTHTLYVANYGAGENVAVVDPTTDPASITGTGYIDSRPWAVGVDPTTHRAFVTTLFGDTVSTVAGTSKVGWVGYFDGPTNLTVDPAHQRAYVNAANTGGVVVLDITTDDPVVVGPVPGLAGPSDTALDASGDLFVSRVNDAAVSVVDRETLTETASVAVGARPTAIKIDTSTQRVYTLNQGTAGDPSISVIQTPVAQAVTFTSTAPTDAQVGDTYTATATGGGSTSPVTFSTTSQGCTVSPDGEVAFTGAGDCVVSATQAADGEYLAAPPVTQTVPVSLVPTTVVLDLPTSTEFGRGTAVGTTSTDVPGTVQYTVDGEPYGDPQQVDEDGGTSLPEPMGSDLAVGPHQVGAELTPADTDTYAASSDTETLTVAKAATTTTLGLHPGGEILADVARTNPGAGVPGGTVELFVSGESIGTTQPGEPMIHDVPAGATREVTAVYSGDGSFEASSASTSRRDPVLTATTSSASARRHGWYRSPVTVTFHCEVTSALLERPCPAPVTVSRSAAAQSVARTIIATDGGAATLVVDGIDVDRVAPRVRLRGVRTGATYFGGGPRAACVAPDGLSGLARCTVAKTRHGNRLTWTARATDRAGNVGVARVVARSTSVWVDGARLRDGLPVVRGGRTYTVLVSAARRPTYLYAAPAPNRPYGGNVAFQRVGKGRWALGVTFDKAMARHGLWNIGTRVGSRTTVTTVRVVR